MRSRAPCECRRHVSGSDYRSGPQGPNRSVKYQNLLDYFVWFLDVLLRKTLLRISIDRSAIPPVAGIILFCDAVVAGTIDV